MKGSNKRWFRRFAVALTIFGLVMLWAARPAQAAETRSGENVVIGRDEVIAGDLYVGASTVTIDGTIKGDLVGAAGQITVNGTVEGDILAAAQSVVINGVVGDDARAFAQAVQVGREAQVAGDLAVGAMSLETQSGSIIKGDVLVGGYQALLAGNIAQDVLAGLDRMELRGTTGGNVTVAVSGVNDVSAVQFSPAGQLPIPTLSAGLTLADSARIDGKLDYRSSSEAKLATGAQIAGGTHFERIQVTGDEPQPGPITGSRYLQQFAGLLLAGMLLLWLAPRWTRHMADSVAADPLPSLAWGLVAFAAFIVALVALLLATIMLAVLLGFLTLGSIVAWVIGFGLLGGSALVFGYITFAAYIAVAIVAFVVGRWLVGLVQPAWIERAYVPLLVGLVLYVLVNAIPWLGTLTSMLVVLLALGALWQWGGNLAGRGQRSTLPVSGLQPA